MLNIRVIPKIEENSGFQVTYLTFVSLSCRQPLLLCSRATSFVFKPVPVSHQPNQLAHIPSCCDVDDICVTKNKQKAATVGDGKRVACSFKNSFQDYSSDAIIYQQSDILYNVPGKKIFFTADAHLLFSEVKWNNTLKLQRKCSFKTMTCSSC